jgi:hypothetical protein
MTEEIKKAKTSSSTKTIIVLGVIAVAALVFYGTMFPASEVKITSFAFTPQTANSGDPITCTIKVKNMKMTSQNVYLECGIVAESSQLSVFPLSFQWGAKCCEGNTNYDGAHYTLLPYEETTIVLKPQMPIQSSTDVCNNGVGSYWKGTGAYYTIAAVLTTDCHVNNGVTLDSNRQSVYMNA